MGRPAVLGVASVLVMLVLVACGGGSYGPSNAEDTAAIRATFDGYKQSLLNEDGEASLAFVDSNTTAYYQEMLDLALRAAGETVRARNTVDKLMVVMLRHLVPLESLKQMNGESLFVYAVNQGWIGTAGVINSDIGDVTVSGAYATGVALSGGM